MTSNTQKHPIGKKAKREAFMSMDREERDILRTLGWRERALYPELKWLADFKTGQVKYFGRRRITYQFLANLIAVPSSQGREAETVDAKEVTRLLMRLHKAGLVGEIDNDPIKGLRFALPLSPICKEQAREQRQIQIEREQNQVSRLPNEAHEEMPEIPAMTGLGGQSTSPLSVMKRIEDHQYLFNTVSNEAAALGAAARDAVAGPSLNPQKTNEAGGAIASSLSLAAIQKRLVGSRYGFSWIDMPASQVMYQRWVSRGYSLDEFEQAVAAVENDYEIEPTPRAVDQVLRSGSANSLVRQREEQKRRRRGGVQL